MLNKRKIKSFIFILTVLILFTMPHDVFARAGGGGGKGGGGAALIFLPYLIIYSIILTFLVFKRSRQCKALLKKLAKSQMSWDMEFLQQRIEEVFFKVQEAWQSRDQVIAQDYMSERLFNKHKAQTDQMLKEHKKNILEKIELKESRIVEVADYKNDSRDRIWVYIRGSMIDYIIDDESGKVRSGDPKNPECFTELWKFVRGSKGWVLDQIDQEVTIKDFRRFHPFSENDQQMTNDSV